jgi:hypothetical protein
MEVKLSFSQQFFGKYIDEGIRKEWKYGSRMAAAFVVSVSVLAVVNAIAEVVNLFI